MGKLIAIMLVISGCVEGWVQITRSGFQVTDDVRVHEDLNIEVSIGVLIS